MSDASGFIVQLSIWALPTIFAIILHEVMHGVVANRFGDDTALRAGRLTLNPVAHIDPVGTVLLPAMLLFLHLPVFGYARPVPVNFMRLRGGRLAMAAVAAAGPLTNFALAVASAAAARTLRMAAYTPLAPFVIQPLFLMAQASIVVNVALMVFNLFPLLPLDGGRVVAGLLPAPAARAYSRLEPYGFLILILLLYTNWVGAIISPIIYGLVRVLL